MSIFYCHRCDELKDSDYEDEIFEFNGELICEDCADGLGLTGEDEDVDSDGEGV